MPLPTPRLAPVTTATLPRNDDTTPSFFQGNQVSEWKQSRSPLSWRCPPHRALAITAVRHGPRLDPVGEQVAADERDRHCACPRRLLPPWSSSRANSPAIITTGLVLAQVG